MAELFSKMSHVVQQQDSILNRIDYNVEQSLQRIEISNVQLEGRLE